MSWLDLRASEKESAKERLTYAQHLFTSAWKAFCKDPSEVNTLTLKAATRLVEESLAEYSEWACDD